MGAPGGFGAAFRRGLVVGLVFVLTAAVAVAAYVVTGHRLPGQGRSDASRVLLIAALPDENGDQVAQVIADADVSGPSPSLRSVDPSTPVTIAGTSYDHLRDTYAFGGGADLAAAYDQVGRVGESLPFIDLSGDALATAVDANGGVKLDLPADMNVFDGDRLYTFPAGPVVADVRELRALLNGAAYLPAQQRLAVIEQVGAQLEMLIADYPGGIQAAIDAGSVGTDLSASGVRAFVTRLTQAD